jgi:hypothetical protein
MVATATDALVKFQDLTVFTDAVSEQESSL